jgi:hypothetical protein
MHLLAVNDQQVANLKLEAVQAAIKESARPVNLTFSDGSARRPAILVWLHRKCTGGAEALFQLYLQLHALGFVAYASRQPPACFQSEYKDELDALPVAVLQVNSLQPGDVLIVPSYTMPALWEELGTYARESRVRVLMWQLQVEGPVDIVPLPTPMLHVGHSVWVTDYLNVPYFGPSRFGILTPHLSPSFLKSAKEAEEGGLLAHGKRELVVMDGDVHWGAISTTKKHNIWQTLQQKHPGLEVVVADGFSKAELVGLLRAAKVVVDLQMPGLERLLLEASVLGSCIVADDGLNGQPRADFPLTDRYSVEQGDAIALQEAISDALTNWPACLNHAGPMRTEVHQQPANFRAQVSFHGTRHTPAPGPPGSVTRLLLPLHLRSFRPLDSTLLRSIRLPFRDQLLWCEGGDCRDAGPSHNPPHHANVHGADRCAQRS